MKKIIEIQVSINRKQIKLHQSCNFCLYSSIKIFQFKQFIQVQCVYYIADLILFILYILSQILDIDLVLVILLVMIIQRFQDFFFFRSRRNEKNMKSISEYLLFIFKNRNDILRFSKFPNFLLENHCDIIYGRFHNLKFLQWILEKHNPKQIKQIIGQFLPIIQTSLWRILDFLKQGQQKKKCVYLTIK
ncbi:hypothetical protein pb186bvf_003874 [Paramecium bursaria]